MSVIKGCLVAVGGAEDKGEKKEAHLDFFKEGILKEILNLVKASPAIEVLTTASSEPDASFQNYKKAFKELGCTKVGHIHIEERSETRNEAYIKRLQDCDLVFITGGDQAKLSAILGGTPIVSTIKERYQKDPLVIAGTSAGAAVMTGVMINGGDERKAYLKGEIDLSVGFGLTNDVIIDTHFDARGRFARLSQAVATQPGIVGIGLSEDTGLIIKKGTDLQVIGSSCVTIIEGNDIFHNNLVEVEDGEPISIGRLGVFVLTKNDVFCLNTKTLLAHDNKAHEKKKSM